MSQTCSVEMEISIQAPVVLVENLQKLRREGESERDLYVRLLRERWDLHCCAEAAGLLDEKSPAEMLAYQFKINAQYEILVTGIEDGAQSRCEQFLAVPEIKAALAAIAERAEKQTG